MYSEKCVEIVSGYSEIIDKNKCIEIVNKNI